MAALVGLQYRLWFGDGSVRDVFSLREAIESQQNENERLYARNRQLEAEVKDLRTGLESIEHRARRDLWDDPPGRDLLPDRRASMTPGSGPIWGLVAAAGAGLRFGSGVPKQYAELDGRPLLAHAIGRLAADRRVRGVMVVLPPGDVTFPRLGFRFGVEVLFAEGGEERSRSVANGLERLGAEGGAGPADWVLVHDAARPCLHPADLAALIDLGLRHPTGALLAAPVRDTLKRARSSDAGGPPEVDATVPRERMWRALTPQMFRVADLSAALAEASERGLAVTDDAEAIEGWAAGRGRPPPRLVEARHENPKVTIPGDLEAAGRILGSRGGARG